MYASDEQLVLIKHTKLHKCQTPQHGFTSGSKENKGQLTADSWRVSTRKEQKEKAGLL